MSNPITLPRVSQMQPLEENKCLRNSVPRVLRVGVMLSPPHFLWGMATPHPSKPVSLS